MNREPGMTQGVIRRNTAVRVIADIIAAHPEIVDEEMGDYFGCDCGWDNGTLTDNNDHPEHVAAIIADHLNLRAVS